MCLSIGETRFNISGKAREEMMLVKTEYNKIQAYTTKESSLIRELMHPNVHGNTQQSLAEAIIPVSSVTLLHRHLKTEEIYDITEGTGLMTLGDEQFKVKVADTVCVLPGTPHQIQNRGKIALKILCCCSPPYSHDDIELLG